MQTLPANSYCHLCTALKLDIIVLSKPSRYAHPQLFWRPTIAAYIVYIYFHIKTFDNLDSAVPIDLLLSLATFPITHKFPGIQLFPSYKYARESYRCES